MLIPSGANHWVIADDKEYLFNTDEANLTSQIKHGVGLTP